MQDGKYDIQKTKKINSVEDRLAVFVKGRRFQVSRKKYEESRKELLIVDDEPIGLTEDFRLRSAFDGRDKWFKVKELKPESDSIILHGTWRYIDVHETENLEDLDLEEGDWLKIYEHEVKKIVRVRNTSATLNR